MKRIEREENGIRELLDRLGLQGLSADVNIIRKAYNRIFTTEERKLLDTNSFGFLISLYQIGTIDSVKLEKYIDFCLSVAYYDEEKLSLDRTKRIVSMLLYCDNLLMLNREFVQFFKEFEEDLSADDTMH